VKWVRGLASGRWRMVASITRVVEPGDGACSPTLTTARSMRSLMPREDPVAVLRDRKQRHARTFIAAAGVGERGIDTTQSRGAVPAVRASV
jgi:hypothetical protein